MDLEVLALLERLVVAQEMLVENSTATLRLYEASSMTQLDMVKAVGQMTAGMFPDKEDDVSA